MNKKETAVTAAVIIIVAVLAAAAYFLLAPPPTSSITEIVLPGQNNTIYTFSTDVREALNYSLLGKDDMRYLLYNSNQLTIVYDGSDINDSRQFQVVLYNLVWKIQQFYLNNNRVLNFHSYYYMGDQWHNATNNITKPVLTPPVLWIKGPHTGATENSVSLANGTIYLQGTTYGNLTLAGDRLTLAVLGVDDLSTVYYAS